MNELNQDHSDLYLKSEKLIHDLKFDSYPEWLVTQPDDIEFKYSEDVNNFFY